ncbi:hypothetical protein J8M20_15195 [Pseudoalteromonas luteoviolacea]|uniref:hypothetical protein n=1 Tax=Pseudoalteromonas luteoviolacea TaxID=43657 RepID=UPI001B36D732|nr:hypothetical protein [Pseudoalteromonas luteoviolacea]MBQ4812704.1 hypothetical protein [Pseudoalteromonas luteoviolacea]
MKEIYAVIEFMPLMIIAFTLVLTWKVPTARWFLLCYAMIDIMNIFLHPITMQWKTHFYLVDLLLYLAFILPIVYRREVALFIYEKTGIDYFSLVYKRQILSVQECGIVLIIALGCVVDLVSWLEVLAYKYYWIDVPYFKLYVRNNLMMLIHIALCGMMFSYAINAEKREKEDLKYDSVE